MKTLTQLYPALLCAAFAVATAPGQAAPLDFKLPAETAKLRPSKLPGAAMAAQKCSICHSADYVNYQPPGMTQAQWTAEMGKMQHAYGAPISDDEVKHIGAYLAVAYGSAKATDASVLALSAPAVPVAATPPSPAQKSVSSAAGSAGSAIDVQALLNNNACLGCHAIAQKIVGPAYKDVAAKYKGDAKAPAMLASKVKAGGKGAWGEIPMPPNNVTPEEAAKLVAWILAQK